MMAPALTTRSIESLFELFIIIYNMLLLCYK